MLSISEANCVAVILSVIKDWTPSHSTVFGFPVKKESITSVIPTFIPSVAFYFAIEEISSGITKSFNIGATISPFFKRKSVSSWL